MVVLSRYSFFLRALCSSSVFHAGIERRGRCNGDVHVRFLASTSCQTPTPPELVSRGEDAIDAGEELSARRRARAMFPNISQRVVKRHVADDLTHPKRPAELSIPERILRPLLRLPNMSTQLPKLFQRNFE
ncbi:hypothetical protein MRX96_008760 [Rhipicephalus microplus]